MPYISRIKINLRPILRFLCLMVLAAVVLILLFLEGCSRGKPIEIGFIGGLSGRVADLGIGGRNGAILAIEQRNNMGGIHGRPIHLIAMDDEQDEDAAKRALTSLFNQGIEAVIGPMTSSIAISILPLANEQHIVMMSPTTTTTYLKDIDDFFFRVCATTDTYGAAMARHLRNQEHLKKVTVIYDLGNQAYTESWTSKFREEFARLGGEIVQQVTYTSGPETHFSEVVRQALNLETDGIVICSNAVDAAMICLQLHKMNVAIPIGISEWAATEKLIELGGISVENVIVSQFFDRYSTADRYIHFKEDFNKRFGEDPGFASVTGYDAANVILDALARKEKDRDLKQTILRLGSFDGVQGKISFNRFGDSNRTNYISIIRQGKFISTGNG